MLVEAFRTIEIASAKLNRAQFSTISWGRCWILSDVTIIGIIRWEKSAKGKSIIRNKTGFLGVKNLRFDEERTIIFLKTMWMKIRNHFGWVYSSWFIILIDRLIFKKRIITTHVLFSYIFRCIFLRVEWPSSLMLKRAFLLTSNSFIRESNICLLTTFIYNMIIKIILFYWICTQKSRVMQTNWRVWWKIVWSHLRT